MKYFSIGLLILLFLDLAGEILNPLYAATFLISLLFLQQLESIAAFDKHVKASTPSKTKSKSKVKSKSKKKAKK